ncbi:MAG: protein-L-isoaspartate(D-aspartate) O-methyltransferase [Rhizobiaceae bacterium]|nr:protein-L-isoaspartate(D-aspartate) O-methyltransferase [Rhizobiaceae bacterium]
MVVNRDNKEALGAFLLRLRSQGITNHQVLSAFEKIPRRNFVPIIHVDEAYARGQMPIECGQSMAAADHVAKIINQMDLEPSHRVLELGTGTGYQTALLSTLASKITSIERFRTLHEKAGTRLEHLGIENVILRLGDATNPSQEWGMFDRIISNCSFDEPPKDFLDTLVSGGILIAPVGPPDGVQKIGKYLKIGSRFEITELMEIRTQPFLSGISSTI